MLGIGRKRAATAARRSTIVLAGLAPVLLVALAKLAAPALLRPGGRPRLRLLSAPLAPALRDAGVRVVDIDDESVRRLGQWPWPRTELAALTEAIADAGAAAIAFDIVFSEADRTSPRFLAEREARRGAEPGAARDAAGASRP